MISRSKILVIVERPKNSADLFLDIVQLDLDSSRYIFPFIPQIESFTTQNRPFTEDFRLWESVDNFFEPGSEEKKGTSY